MSSPSNINIDLKRDEKCPLVSIGIPTYNCSGSVANAVKSVLGQSYKNVEIVISDNCSTDDTQIICTKLSESNSAIRYIRQPANIGLVANFSYVLKNSSGEFFMWLAADDYLEPGILENCIFFLTTHPNYTLVSGQIQYWEGNWLKVRERDFNLEHDRSSVRVISFYSNVTYGGIFHGMMPRQCAEKIPLLHGLATDWHFVAALAFLGKVKNLNCVGYNKRLDGSSKNFKRYARIIGVSWFSANFPHLKIAIDVFFEVMFGYPFCLQTSLLLRFFAASASCVGILFNYYFRKFPFVVGGKIKRLAGFGKSKMKNVTESAPYAF
jgi:glycosyltransferase involved in cell wall biosynthesis